MTKLRGFYFSIVSLSLGLFIATMSFTSFSRDIESQVAEISYRNGCYWSAHQLSKDMKLEEMAKKCSSGSKHIKEYYDFLSKNLE